MKRGTSTRRPLPLVSTRSRNRLAARPGLEPMEERALMASGPLTVVLTELETGQSFTIVDNDANDSSNALTGTIKWSIPTGAVSPFDDFSITGLQITSNRAATPAMPFGQLTQGGTVFRTTSTGGPRSLEVQVFDTGFTNPTVPSALRSSASATFTNSHTGDQATFQSFANTTSSPVVTLVTNPEISPFSASGNAAPTPLSIPSPYDLKDVFRITLGPSDGPGLSSASIQNSGSTTVNGTNSLTIAGTVFSDLNHNNLQDLAGEFGIAGVPVALTGTDSAGNAVSQSTVTAGDGTYSFVVARGSNASGYKITEGIAPGYLHEGQIPGTTGGTPGTRTITTVLPSLTNSFNNNFSEELPAAVTGYVYVDADNNGLRATSGEGTVGATVPITLTGTDVTGASITLHGTADATTGFYSFAGLYAGTYSVAEDAQPAGFLDGQETRGNVAPLPNSVGTDGIPGIVVSAGQTAPDNNFGEVPPVSLSGFIYVDSNNDGTKQGTEAGIPGVTVTVAGIDDLGQTINVPATTLADGSYSVTGLRPGTYTITETQPAAYLDGRDAVGTLGAATILNDQFVGIDATTPGALGMDYNFGELVPSSLSGFVYVDSNNDGTRQGTEAGIPGAIVTLTGANDLGAVTLAMATLADGSYSFGNLRPGTYAVAETQPSGYADGKDTIGTPGGTSGNDVFSAISLGQGVAGQDNNFGEMLPISITGTVYLDTTGNGLSADDVVFSDSTVEVDLYLDNGDGVLGAGDTKVAYQLTPTSTGFFNFTNVAPGTYFVKEVTPTGYVRTAPTPIAYYTVAATTPGTSYDHNDFDNFEIDDCQMVNITYVITGSAGTRTVTDLRGNVNEGDTVTAFFKNGGTSPDTVSLVSYVAPGPTFDAGQAYLQSIYQFVTVTLDPGQSGSATVHVPNSDFQVDFVCGLPIDHFGPAGGSVFYSAQKRLFSADNDGTVAPGTLSGYVYHDADDDGVKDANESGISGVTVKAYNSAGALAGTATTDANGFYKFTNLPADTYELVESQPSAYLDGKDTLGNAGGTAGNDVFTGIALTRVYPGYAAGKNYNFGEVLASSLAGFVYIDSNDNGAKDSGERGLSGVTVKLTGTDDLGQSVSASTTTGADGSYSFPGLRPGSYTLTEVQPGGYATTGNTVGTAGGSLATPRTDAIATIPLKSNVSGAGYNFGELACNGAALGKGMTATIGFWHNNNGQALILSLNGGASSKALGNWLAQSFPNVYAGLAGMTNTQIASYFLTLFNVSGQKTEAQFLAGALAVYSTNSTLAGGNYAAGYGFTVNGSGTGVATYNVGTQLAPYGGPTGTVTILQLIQFVNSKSLAGRLANGNSALLGVINTIFSDINQKGDIK